MPRLKQIELVPLCAWLKDPHLTIPKTAILAFRDETNMANVLYKPDTVKVISHLPAVTNASNTKNAARSIGIYPESTGDSPTGKMATVSMPTWAAVYLERDFKNKLYKPEKGKGCNTPRLDDQASSSSTKEEATKAAEDMEDSVTAFAKMAFAEMSNEAQSVTVKIPWTNFGMIDNLGYVAELPDMINEASGKLYGMVQRVRLRIGRSATACTAEMYVHLSHVRDDSANDALGLSQHPFYDFDYDSGVKPLTGIKSSGELNLKSKLGPGK